MTEDESPTDFDHIDELILACVEASSTGADSAQTLQRCCADHPDLADELQARYQALVRVGMLPADERRPGGAVDRLGPYRLVECLGRGGMGIVHLAVRDGDPRRVALKLIRPELLASETARSRFAREMHAARSLDHPSLCSVYEAGEIEGQPYLAMELIEGETLEKQLADTRGAGVVFGSDHRAAVTLVEQLARAVHIAHEAGFVHRDIKPANVMMTADRRPVLLDFGLAHDTEDLTLTGSFATLGTPSYMAPEQVAPRTGTADRRTDVHALGALLYECVTLRAPYAGRDRGDTYRRLLLEEPIDVRRLQPSVGTPLATVVHKALAKNPPARYPTALAMAEDLQRILVGQPIRARPPGAFRRAGRWVRRRPVLTTAFAGGAFAVALAAIVGLSMLQSLRASYWTLELQNQIVAARNLIEDDPALAAVMLQELLARSPGEPARSAFLEALGSLREVERRPLGNAVLSIDASPDGSLVAVGVASTASERPELVVLDAELDALFRIECERDPRFVHVDAARERLLVGGHGGRARLFDLRGAQIARLGKDELRFCRGYADGKVLTLALDGRASLWESSTGDLIRHFPSAEEGIVTAAYHPETLRVAIGTRTGRVTCWNAATGWRAWTRRAQQSIANCLRFLPDGRLVTASLFDERWLRWLDPYDSHLRIWRPDGALAQVHRLLSGSNFCDLQLSGSGAHLVASGADQRAYVLTPSRDPVTDRPTVAQTPMDHDSMVLGARFVGGDEAVLTRTYMNQAYVWSRYGQKLATLGGHTGGVAAATITADGKTAFTASGDGVLRRFDIASRWRREHCAPWAFTLLRFDPESGDVWTTNVAHEFRRWTGSTDPWARRDSPRFPGIAVGNACAWCPVRERYLIGTIRGGVYAADPTRAEADPSRLAVLREPDDSEIWWLCCAQESAAIGFRQRQEVQLLTPQDTWIPLRWPVAGEPIKPCAFSPDSRRLVVSSAGGRLGWFDAVTGELLDLRDGVGVVHAVAFPPGSSSVCYAASERGTIRRCRFEGGGSEVFACHEDGVPINAVAVHPDGTVATADRRGEVILWSPEGQALVRQRFPAQVLQVAFDAGGNRLACATRQGQLIVWRVADLLGEPADILARSPYREAVENARARFTNARTSVR